MQFEIILIQYWGTNNINRKRHRKVTKIKSEFSLNSGLACSGFEKPGHSRPIGVIKLMLCSTWNYCMKKGVLKSAHVPIVETFRGKLLHQSQMMPLMKLNALNFDNFLVFSWAFQ